MNKETIRQLLIKTNLNPHVAEILYPSMNRSYIDKNVRRAACFLATCAIESGNFTKLVENMNYSAKRLAEVWPKRFRGEDGKPNDFALKIANNPEAIANSVYANRMGNGPAETGDGWRFRGRGYIHLTGKDNYKRYGEYLGLDLENNPELAEKEDIAAEIAAEFWHRSNLNDAADVLDLVAIRRKVNGGLIGFNEFKGLVFKMLT